MWIKNEGCEIRKFCWGNHNGITTNDKSSVK